MQLSASTLLPDKPLYLQTDTILAQYHKIEPRRKILQRQAQVIGSNDLLPNDLPYAIDQRHGFLPFQCYVQRNILMGRVGI